MDESCSSSSSPTALQDCEVALGHNTSELACNEASNQQVAEQNNKYEINGGEFVGANFGPQTHNYNLTKKEQCPEHTADNLRQCHYRLAELQTEVELLRSLVYRACGLYVKGHDVTSLTSMVKLKAGRLIREVADSCLQYWGGMGFTQENLVSRLYRDGRLWSIGGGADEVMLSILCKYMGTLPKVKKEEKPVKKRQQAS